MLCRLQDLVSELKKSYNVKTTHSIGGAVSAVRPLPMDTAVALNSQTLYVVTPGELAAVATRSEDVPMLCVTQYQAIIDGMIFPKRKVIVVECESLPEVLLKLTEIMFQLGQRSSDIGELTARLLSCHSCAELVELGSKFIENPILLTDPMLNVVSHTRNPPVDGGAWQEFISGGYLRANTARMGLMISDMSSDASNVACIVREENGEFSPMVQKALWAQGSFLGYLMVPAMARDITDTDVELCDIIGNLAASMLLRNDQVINPAGSREAYLSAIIDAPILREEEIKAELVKLGWRPKLHMYIMSLSNSGQLLGKTLRETNREILNALPDTMAVAYKNGTIFLWETSEIMVENDPRLNPVFQLLTQYSSRMGISRDFSSLTKLRDAYFQARKALELGERLEPGFRLHPYERYGAYHILEMCASYENLSTFAYPNFEELVAYDSGNDGELVKTLFAYLKYCGNLQKVSQELFIHQNTVRYRLSQISRILRCNLTEGETFFQLCLTEKIIKMQSCAETQEDAYRIGR